MPGGRQTSDDGSVVWSVHLSRSSSWLSWVPLGSFARPLNTAVKILTCIWLSQWHGPLMTISLVCMVLALIDWWVPNTSPLSCDLYVPEIYLIIMYSLQTPYHIQTWTQLLSPNPCLYKQTLAVTTAFCKTRNLLILPPFQCLTSHPVSSLTCVPAAFSPELLEAPPNGSVLPFSLPICVSLQQETLE